MSIRSSLLAGMGAERAVGGTAVGMYGQKGQPLDFRTVHHRCRQRSTPTPASSGECPPVSVTQ
jgi:hypothetical protein